MISRPEVVQTADSVQFRWMQEQVGIGFEFLHERAGNLHGEVSIVGTKDGANDPDHIHWARLNLSSTTAREDLVKLLTKRTNGNGHGGLWDWGWLVEYACTVAAQRYRAGEPFVNLAGVPKPRGLTFLLGRLLPVGQTSVIFSRGAAGKSLLAMAMAVATATGRPLPGGLVPVRPQNTLYLDYESDEEEQRLRLDWIRVGMGLADVPAVIYRHQTRPLADDISKLRQEIVAREIGLVVVDSIAYALGGDPMDARLVIEAFNALRSFGPSVTRLVIAHIPKAEKEAKQAGIFGSVYFENAGRSNWEMRTVDDRQGISVGLFPRKQNWGKKQSPIGLRFTFDDSREAVTPTYHDVSSDSGLVVYGSVPYRLKAALRTGGEWTIKTLVEQLGEKNDAIESALARLERNKEVTRIGGGRGRSHEARWALVAEQDDEDVPF